MPTPPDRWKQLKTLAGYLHDGSQETVKLGWDDATRAAFLKVGKRFYYGPSLENVLRQAMEEPDEAG